ncbi:hypothetical protein JCM10207_000392 [Rhodosporidiobolus poonsookiae]
MDDAKDRPPMTTDDLAELKKALEGSNATALVEHNLLAAPSTTANPNSDATIRHLQHELSLSRQTSSTFSLQLEYDLLLADNAQLRVQAQALARNLAASREETAGLRAAAVAGKGTGTGMGWLREDEVEKENRALKADVQHLQQQLADSQAETLVLQHSLKAFRAHLLHGAPLIATDYEVSLPTPPASSQESSGGVGGGGGGAGGGGKKHRGVRLGDAESELLLHAGKTLSHVRRIERVPLDLAIRQQAEDILRSASLVSSSSSSSRVKADPLAPYAVGDLPPIPSTSTSTSRYPPPPTSLAPPSSLAPPLSLASTFARSTGAKGPPRALGGNGSFDSLVQAATAEGSGSGAGAGAGRGSKRRRSSPGTNGWARRIDEDGDGDGDGDEDEIEDDYDLEPAYGGKGKGKGKSQSGAKRAHPPPSLARVHSICFTSDAQTAASRELPLPAPAPVAVRSSRRAVNARRYDDEASDVATELEDDELGDDDGVGGLDADDADWAPAPPASLTAGPPLSLSLQRPPPRPGHRSSHGSGSGGGRALGTSLSALDVLAAASQSQAQAQGGSPVRAGGKGTSRRRIKPEPADGSDASDDEYDGGAALVGAGHAAGGAPAAKKARLPYTKWTVAEDEVLVKAVIECGCAWDAVARLCPTRAYHQVRQRFLRGLRSGQSLPAELAHYKTAVLRSVNEYEAKKQRKKAAKQQAERIKAEAAGF